MVERADWARKQQEVSVSQADDLLGAILGMQMLQKELLRHMARDPEVAAAIIDNASEQIEKSGSFYSSGALAYLEGLSASLNNEPRVPMDSNSARKAGAVEKIQCPSHI